ncbi:MAG: hypothetical protein ACTSSP_00220 [Candidatus Asgardarchaeia archaeon]
MKIKRGFVSNSSTTSFMAYGICADSNEIMEALKETGTITDGEDFECISDWTWDNRKVLEDMEIDCWLPPYDDTCYMGVSYNCLKDDETGKQFKDRVTAEMKKLLGDKFDFSIIEDGWRDG